MKVIFLDIDGVLNSVKTFQRYRGLIGIDPYMVMYFNRIIFATDAKIVISSSWRHHSDSLKEIETQVMPFIGVTPSMPKSGGAESMERGYEIKAWLEKNILIKCETPTSCPPPTRAMCTGHKIDRYAILDDDSDMLPEQLPNFFKTSWATGLTEEIANQVIAHLNSPA